ncbi:MAG: methyltransferase domain-containing protein [Nanoarchaeota archaeon]
MKVRESGMPEEKTWKDFFSPSHILKKMRINNKIKDIVDFGCGYGTFTIPTARMVSGKVYAIDIEPEMVKKTKRKVRKNRLSNVETILHDFVSNGSGLKDKSVDYVMLFNILHTDKPERLLREAYRILRNGGKLGIIHWNYDSTTPRGPPMEIRPKPEQCIGWATNSGFNSPIKYDLKPYHYGIIMEKRK